MRALALNEVPSAPAVAEADPPAPGTGELLVKVAGSSVNDFDLSVTSGRLEGMTGHRFPLVPGMDCAGTLGDGGEGFPPGTRSSVRR